MIRLEDGREYSTPSAAAMHAAGLQAYDGWYAWRVDNEQRPRLHDLRSELISRSGSEETTPGDAEAAADNPVSH
jgi:hypothetical protein